MNFRRKPRQNARRGASLIEVIVTGIVVAVTLVPALRMMRDSLAVNVQTETADAMTTFCASKLEQALAQTCATWTTGTDTGTFSTEGYASLRYSVVKSDLPPSGGISNRLMAITATVWNDSNGNGVLDSSERRIVFASKVAKMQTYTTGS
jgi:hypothetical protein